MVKASAQEVRIMTYNLKFLPRFAFTLGHHPVKRAKLIPQHLINDSVDVVVFEEMFDPLAIRILSEKLQPAYPYIIGPGKFRPKGFKRGSGVMIASKFPITALEKIRYSQCKGYDCYAHKGAILVEVNAPQQRFQLFGTHMQSGGSNALKLQEQLEAAALLQRHRQPGVPQLIAGDFNIRQNDTLLYNAMIRNLECTNDSVCGTQKWTSDHFLNDMYPFSETKRRQLDYILYIPNGVKPSFMERTVKMYRQRWSARHQDLSDHFALMMRLKF